MGMLDFSQMLITKAFWGKCIDFFVELVGNYGWAIILLTIAIKLILSPIDIIQKRMNKKNADFQAIMQPELQKVQQQYPGDRNKLNQKQMELAKKHNFNMTGTCLTLFITLIVSLIVFSSLFVSLNSLSTKQENIAFNEIYNTYISAQEYTVDNSEFLQENGVEIDQDKVNEYIASQVKAKFEDQSNKYSFMWVRNVWKGDTTTSPVVKYSTFKKYALKNGIATEETLPQLEQAHKDISSIIEAKYEYNGCYVLIILAGAVTFLTQFIQTKIQQKKSGGVPNPSSKTMLIIMPLIMVIFASTSSALFTLYIITSSIMSFLLGTVIDLFIKDKKDKNGQVLYKKGNTEVVEYSRNYNKG